MSKPEHIAPIIKRVVDTYKLTPREKPKRFVPKEFDEQCQVFEYARIAAKGDGRWSLLFATLNGVRLPIGLAKKAKRAGNRAGVPDMFLPVVGYASCPGLFIELKRVKGGQVSDEQEWFHEQLRKQGYVVLVCKGAKAAIAAIEEYLRESHG